MPSRSWWCFCKNSQLIKRDTMTGYVISNSTIITYPMMGPPTTRIMSEAIIMFSLAMIHPHQNHDEFPFSFPWCDWHNVHDDVSISSMTTWDNWWRSRGLYFCLKITNPPPPPRPSSKTNFSRMSTFTHSVRYFLVFSPVLYFLHFKCPFPYFPPCPLPLHIFPFQISRGGGGIIHPCGGMQSAEVAVAAFKYSGITWKRYNNFLKVRSYFASVWNLLNALAYTFEMLKAPALLTKNWNRRK
jgi:hypothetical protein